MNARRRTGWRPRPKFSTAPNVDRSDGHADAGALRAYVEDEAGSVVAVALRTPPHPLLVSTLADAAAAPALAGALRDADVDLGGAMAGPEPDVGVVARALAERIISGFGLPT